MLDPRRSTRRIASLTVTLCLAQSAVAASARAQAGQAAPAAADEAREHFHAGIEHFNAGRYADAELSFSLGYELSRKPGFLWNMAEAARSAGARERALTLYRRYVAEAEPDAPRLPEAREWVRVLEATQPTEVEPLAVSPSAAAAAAETRAAEHSPEPALRVSAQGPAAPSDSDESPALYERWWFWAGAGAVVAGSVLAALLIAQSDAAEPDSVRKDVLGIEDYR